MELTTVYIWGSLGAAFCLVVGALIGHTIYEYQQQATDAIWREWLAEANERAAMAEQGCEFNGKYRKALVEALISHDLWDFNKHYDNPTFMLTSLMDYVAECAIDPKQNREAKNLYVKGVRAGAKKGREQMQKLMQKSIDNQATAITNMYETLSLSHKREDIYRAAVSNTLTDKVGLVSVRRAIIQGIAAECTRLRAVEAKKGE